MSPDPSELPLVLRIVGPTHPRSQVAHQSQAPLHCIDIPWVPAENSSFQSKEAACLKSHQKALRFFVNDSKKSHAIILEDDAIFHTDLSWIGIKDYDFLIPFAQNRKQVEPNTAIRERVLTPYGSFAYLMSRPLGRLMLADLEATPTKLAVDNYQRAWLKQNGSSFRYGSFAGNLVQHDPHAPSQISEFRRIYSGDVLNQLPSGSFRKALIERLKAQIGDLPSSSFSELEQLASQLTGPKEIGVLRFAQVLDESTQRYFFFVPGEVEFSPMQWDERCIEILGIDSPLATSLRSHAKGSSCLHLGRTYKILEIY
jgi:hypothetical protein